MIRIRGLNIHQNFKINHIGNTAPSNPWIGMIWFDTSSTNPTLKFWNGSEWKEIKVKEANSVSSISWSNISNTPTTLAGYGITNAYTKDEIDNLLQGLNPKQSVKVATTGNIDIFNPPTSIDGISLNIGDRILVKDQTNQAQNGIYIFNGSGQALTRASDADTWNELVRALVWIESGNTNSNTSWVCNIPSSGILGTDPIIFVRFATSGGMQPYNTNLTSISNLTSTGISVRLNNNTWVTRSLQAGSNKVNISNGDGVNGNPTIDINENNININNLSGTLTPLKGGTGLSSLGNSNQILGVNSSGTALEYKNIIGKTNQINISYENNNIQISTPQDIAETSSPTFKRLILTEANLSPFIINSSQRVTNLNADLLDGFHASQTPGANLIPVADQNGKLDSRWLPTVATQSYARYYIQTSFPSSPQLNDMVFRSDQKRLYKWNGSSWEEINWQTLVKFSPEWENNRLRINSHTNDLEISPDGTNWYSCYPLVGAQIFRLMTIDNTNFSYKYFLLPGHKAFLENTNHLPFTFIINNEYQCNIRYQLSSASNNIMTLYIGNIATSSYAATYYRLDNTFSSDSQTFNGHRIGNTDAGLHYYSIFFTRCGNPYIETICQYKGYFSTYGALASTSHSAWSSSIYWLGTFRSNATGNPLITVQWCVVEKRI